MRTEAERGTDTMSSSATTGMEILMGMTAARVGDGTISRTHSSVMRMRGITALPLVTSCQELAMLMGMSMRIRMRRTCLLKRALVL